MIKSYIKFSVLLLLLCTSCKEDSNQILPQKFIGENKIVGEVVGISDGDSFKIKLSNGEVIRVRLAFVDCPERGQDFYQKAKNFSSNEIYRKSVKVKVTDTDRYGRTVGVLYYGHKILNEELLKNGFAWHYRQYSKSKRFQSLENQAKAKKIGIWSHSQPTPPWEFRRTHIQKRNTNL
ncbi:MAG: nuclease [Flavobacteriales bacterium CG_4_9_14_3_um_filter_40_17]|nr:MAG: nuclease [Flavobacteriales bacterium CG_4_9_14_3_um_filter_40_17]